MRKALSALLAAAFAVLSPAAVSTQMDLGVPSKDPTRAPVSLALATVALRNTPLTLTMLEQHANRENAIVLMAEGFDMLEEDLDKERFFAFARRTYWAAADGSTTRALMQTLIGKLEF